MKDKKTHKVQILLRVAFAIDRVEKTIIALKSLNPYIDRKQNRPRIKELEKTLQDLETISKNIEAQLKTL